MSHTSMHAQKPGTPAALVMVLISLVALLAVGCDSEDFDSATNNTNPANVGGVTDLVFQFKPLPVNATTVDFEFYDSTTPDEGTLIYTATTPSANTVTVQNVPVRARSVLIEHREWLGSWPETVAVVLSYLPLLRNGASIFIDLTKTDFELVTFESISVSPNPIILDPKNGLSQQLRITGSFSNGETAFDVRSFSTRAHFSGYDGSVATVDAGGIVTGVSDGNTSIDVDFTIGGVTRSQLDVPINVTSEVVDTDTLQPSSP